MIKRCFKRQWAGLSEEDRSFINRQTEVGSDPTFIKSNVGQITRLETALWRIPSSVRMESWQTILMSVKSEWYE